MNLELNDNQAQEVPKQAVEEGLKRMIKDDLIRLNTLEAGDQYPLRDAEIHLGAIDAKLNELAEKYPNDKELVFLTVLAGNLRSDLDALKQGGEGTLRFDDSTKTVVTVMRSQIDGAGIQNALPDEVPQNLEVTSLLEQLTGLGIEVDYLRLNPNPNAPTIILFLQAHPNPGMSEEYVKEWGIEASQAEIERGIHALVENGVTREGFSEGFGPEQIQDARLMQRVYEAYPDYLLSGDLRAKRDLGDAVTLRGADEFGLIVDTMHQMKRGELAGGYRETVQNVFIGAQTLGQCEPGVTYFMSFGALHEKILGEANPLPISEVLSYFGANVLVVDTSEGFTKKALSLVAKGREKKAEGV